MKEIYLVRHGQTDFNIRGIVQGKGVNSDLNEKGWQQAMAFYEYYRREPFEVVYTSTLKRTHQTMRPFLEAGVPHIESPHLDEIDWGIYEGQVPTPEMHRSYLAIMEAWQKGEVHTRCDEGESAWELFSRQQPFIEQMRDAPFKKILVCSHGRAIRSLLCGFLERPLHEMDTFHHDNTCLYKLVYDGSAFNAVCSNDLTHLGK